jgi:hypothetical protein
MTLLLIYFLIGIIFSTALIISAYTEPEIRDSLESAGRSKVFLAWVVFVNMWPIVMVAYLIRHLPEKKT